MIGWDYGDALLAFPEGAVYVMDLSPDCFLDAADPGRLTWIDHHKTAIEKWPSSLHGYRIDGVAACRLAWQWFAGFHNSFGYDAATKVDFVHCRVDEPWAVRLAGEYDIWDKRDPNAELFQHGLRSMELGPEHWKVLLARDNAAEIAVRELLHNGVVLQYAKARENESIIKAAGFTVEFEGFRLLACNAARYNSQLFAAGLTPEHDGCLGFNWDGKQWRVSLYTDKPGVDLSPVAVKYGGGGHRGACGFRCQRLPFVSL